MEVKAKSGNVLILVYDKMWEKELAQKCIDALHHSNYKVNTELFTVDGIEYLAVKAV